MQLADAAVYTIRHPQELARIAANGKLATLRERKRWVAAKTLFEAARAQDLEMVVLYADAAHDCSKLIYWGTVTQLDVDATGTSYTVANLSPVSRHRTQELVLRSTGRNIAEGYLRPYALIRRPPFIRQRAGVASARSNGPAVSESVTPTLFSFGYWGSGSATRALVDAVNQAEALRGFDPPLWVDIRISRSVRAVGFRDHGFETLLGSAHYLHMKDLGNQRVAEGEIGMKIRRPAAANDLLDHALASPRRRVIFFCACEVPADCHRHEVARLLQAAAKRRGVDANVVEWPGGKPTTACFEVAASVLRAVERGAQKTLALPREINAAAAAALPWGTTAVLTAGGKRLSVLLGPAHFSARGAHLKIVAVNPGPGAGAAFQRANGYDAR